MFCLLPSATFHDVCRTGWFDDRKPWKFGSQRPLKELEAADFSAIGSLNYLPKNPDPDMCLMRRKVGNETLIREMSCESDICTLCAIKRSKMTKYLRGKHSVPDGGVLAR